jgi:hypothetical protein
MMLEQQADNWISEELRDRRDVVRQELLNEILISDRTRDIIRMSSQAFVDLCKKLMIEGDLKPSHHASVEEQVAKFLYIVGHNIRNRSIYFFFRRSGESNCRHFHNVLRSMMMLEETYFQQPDRSQIPNEISSNRKFYPYFKVKKIIIHLL